LDHITMKISSFMCMLLSCVMNLWILPLNF